MLIFRITHENYSRDCLLQQREGDGMRHATRLFIVLSQFHCFLENMVRRQGVGFNDNFSIMIIEIPMVR